LYIIVILCLAVVVLCSLSQWIGLSRVKEKWPTASSETDKGRDCVHLQTLPAIESDTFLAY